MLNHKTYMNILNLEEKIANGFSVGDKIMIQEKIDGANASFQYDSESDSLQAFSRKQILSADNNLRGFYEFVQSLDKELVKSVLGDNFRMFGEWLVPHTLKYPEEKYNNMYCYDVYDMKNALYLPQNEVKQLVECLGLNYVPVFYEGEFTSWEDCIAFVGRTEMGGEIGEGIVIKNETKLNNPNIRTPFYTKIVHEKFQERHKPRVRHVNIEAINEKNRLKAIVETVVTKARVEKILHKLVDEGILCEDFGLKDMKTICKNLPSAVYYDCLKEAPDIVEEVENFGRFSGNISITLVKEIIAERDS
ncbi:MAG: RNA ligase family protein [Ruminococcus sp.]|nr:RNA ligase family protein [Ruminococcus sp.]